MYIVRRRKVRQMKRKAAVIFAALSAACSVVLAGKACLDAL